MPLLTAQLKPFNEAGEYVADWIDVTSDTLLKKIGTITQQLDNDEYNAGVLNNSTLSISLANEEGKYSEVGTTQSIFQYTRNNSLFRLVWNAVSNAPICGIAICGEAILAADDVVVFEGLLNDDTLQTDIKDQIASFKVMGRESIFSQVETPFASLTNGDTFEEVIYTCLNQTEITSLLTVSAANINVGTDQEVDDISGWENTTVKEVLDEVLEASGSVLYIEDDAIIVKGRTQTPSASLTFYGQASTNGLENILSLKNIRTGLNKMFNYWTWSDTDRLKQNVDTALVQGIRKKEIGYDFITNDTKRDAILTYNLDEFESPKEELDITVTLTDNHLALNLLEGVSIDYPTVYKAASGELVPIYGVSLYGTAIYPVGEYTKIFTTDTIYKIMGSKIDLKKNLITFKLRQI